MMNKRLIPLVLLGLFVLALFTVALGTTFRKPQMPAPMTTPIPLPVQGSAVPSQDAQPTEVEPAVSESPSTSGGVRTFPDPAPVYTPIPVDWVPLLDDDFENPDVESLPTIRQPGMTAKYYDGYYQMFIVAPGQMGFVSHQIGTSNNRLQVDAMMTAGSRMNYYGILCRFSDRNNFYYFAVSSGGAFAVGKVVDGMKTSLITDEFLPSEIVNKELEEVNHFDVICDGPHLYLTVNNDLLASVVDHDLVAGDRFGLLASAAEESGVSIYFDNLEILRVP